MNQWIDPAKADFSLEVMVVEDESMVAIMIEDMLEDLGHRVVVTSGSMSKASKIVADASADLAILDVNLNGEETYPLAASLRSREIPFIFATGYGACGIRAEWSDVPVLQKPFQARELAEAIDHAIRR
ncbi:response regulator [Bradyrhizobium genosp. L]|uniref:response regulator n=1 Tax=Bradyrhizobium genosp. L TaxID=83637 RepID=UPI0018A2CB49|nr:response regulator [Bradyrhizobium genosp. L]QPF83810.1 response regulator [Bradyrhizobium genosp. L]